jgi:hypothetical protein
MKSDLLPTHSLPTPHAHTTIIINNKQLNFSIEVESDEKNSGPVWIKGEETFNSSNYFQIMYCTLMTPLTNATTEFKLDYCQFNQTANISQVNSYIRLSTTFNHIMSIQSANKDENNETYVDFGGATMAINNVDNLK